MPHRKFLTRRRKGAILISEISDLVRLWVLRILVPLGGHSGLFDRHSFNDCHMGRTIGMGKMVDDEGDDFDHKAVLALLRKIHRAGERKLCDPELPAVLGDNIARLSALVGLSASDCRILAFAVLIKNERILEDAADFLGQISTGRLHYALSVVLDIPESEIRSALAPGGILASSGLLSVDRSGSTTVNNKLDLLSSSFADTILFSDVDPMALLRDMVSPGRESTLTLNDFSHIKQPLKILLPYIAHALEKRRRGVNVLLYGPPGTGKSELFRLLAKELSCENLEIASEDEKGDPVDGQHRLKAFRAAQSFFGKRRALVLFDEVEDILDDGLSLFFLQKPVQQRKAWMNRMLETNMAPTIWVSNSVNSIDAAVIRRFDLVIEVPIPTRSVRERIIRNACDGMLPPEAVGRIAGVEALAPAIISRAVSVVKCIGESLSPEDYPKMVESLVGYTLKAQGHRLPSRHGYEALPGTYDPLFINADADLVGVSGGLVASKSGRLCLYGPPGTGKTAYGRWLAEKLDVPLCVKKASDLFSKWVGGTEENIAKAFREAEAEGGLLLIDEIDSFLQDRRRAQRSWEVTGVNEMLTQMESFSGVFIASTNLMTGLDQAALRRFDLKVKFDFLKSEQAWRLLRRHCRVLGLAEPGAKLKGRLSGLSYLTPGDFAAVARQNRFRPIASARSFVEALEQECLVKEEGQRKAAIGFL